MTFMPSFEPYHKSRMDEIHEKMYNKSKKGRKPKGQRYFGEEQYVPCPHNWKAAKETPFVVPPFNIMYLADICEICGERADRRYNLKDGQWIKEK